MKEIVASFVCELKNEIKSKILVEVTASIMPELTHSVTHNINTLVYDKIDTKTEKFEHQTKEIFDNFQTEFETLREKCSAQAKEHRKLKKKT